MGEYDGHAPARFEKLKIPLDEQQDIAANFVLPFAICFLRQVELMQDARILDVASEGSRNLSLNSCREI